MAYNLYSKFEDADLYSAMEDICDYATQNMVLPDGWIFEHWTKIPYDRIHQWHLNNGFPPEEISHLLTKNPSGAYASIQPDGGLIVAVYKDIGGNINEWIPMLASEAKHQESDVGNAIERVFKNYNAIKDIFMELEIFPYICFGQGKGLESTYEQNKLIAGMGNNINLTININDNTFTINEAKNSIKPKQKKVISNKRGNFLVREAKWEKYEMYEKLIIAMKQSYAYFFPQN